jgi:hypothetical protein
MLVGIVCAMICVSSWARRHDLFRSTLKMVKLQEAENQIVVDYEVYDQRPRDCDLL